jgi:hypothetical protein
MRRADPIGPELMSVLRACRFGVSGFVEYEYGDGDHLGVSIEEFIEHLREELWRAGLNADATPAEEAHER